MPSPTELVGRSPRPVLGLFGGADQGIPRTPSTTFDGALSSAGVEHDLVTTTGAPHSFFDRKAAEFQDASDRRVAAHPGFIGATRPQKNARA